MAALALDLFSFGPVVGGVGSSSAAGTAAGSMPSSTGRLFSATAVRTPLSPAPLKRPHSQQKQQYYDAEAGARPGFASPIVAAQTKHSSTTPTFEKPPQQHLQPTHGQRPTQPPQLARPSPTHSLPSSDQRYPSPPPSAGWDAPSSRLAGPMPTTSVLEPPERCASPFPSHRQQPCSPPVADDDSNMCQQAQTCAGANSGPQSPSSSNGPRRGRLDQVRGRPRDGSFSSVSSSESNRSVKSVRFFEIVEVRYTYPSASYDRSSLPMSELSRDDIIDLIRYRNEMRRSAPPSPQEDPYMQMQHPSSAKPCQGYPSPPVSPCMSTGAGPQEMQYGSAPAYFAACGEEEPEMVDEGDVAGFGYPAAVAASSSNSGCSAMLQ